MSARTPSRSLLRTAAVVALFLGAGSGVLAAPGDTPRSGSSSPAQVRPVDPAPQPAGRQKILDELFDRLSKAGDKSEAQGIAGAIERVWMRSGSDTADLLMGRAMQAFSQKDYTLTQDLLGSVVEIEPGWAEAWNKRATVRFFANDDMGAMQDLAHVLALEPRHFGALSGMGFILQRGGFDKRALDVFRRALEINPRQEDVRRLVDKLTLEVEGQGI